MFLHSSTSQRLAFTTPLHSVSLSVCLSVCVSVARYDCVSVRCQTSLHVLSCRWTIYFGCERIFCSWLACQHRAIAVESPSNII